MKIGGLIYLHDISSSIGTTTKEQFKIFHALCKNFAAKAVILGTTRGESLKKEIIEKREKQLREERVWEEMFKDGARMAHFQNTSESAWKMAKIAAISIRVP